MFCLYSGYVDSDGQDKSAAKYCTGSDLDLVLA